VVFKQGRSPISSLAVLANSEILSKSTNEILALGEKVGILRPSVPDRLPNKSGKTPKRSVVRKPGAA
jgi:hypothetical protein